MSIDDPNKRPVSIDGELLEAALTFQQRAERFARLVDEQDNPPAELASTAETLLELRDEIRASIETLAHD